MSSVPPRDPAHPPSTPGYVLDRTGLRLYDGTTNDYMQDGDLGVTMHMDAVSGNAQFRGTVRASQIQGHQGGATGTGARMWLDFTAGDPVVAPAGATAGVSPYWAITDDNGVVRVEAGILAALGNSPLQWGMRVNDANHKPIWDALGLMGVNPAASLVDGYPVFGNVLATILTVPVPSVAHVGTSFFVIAQVDLVATEAGAIGDTLLLSLALDGSQARLLGEPIASLAVTPPFTNKDFAMGIIFWTFTMPDVGTHALTVMAGSASGTATINKANTALANQSNVRLGLLQLGN